VQVQANLPVGTVIRGRYIVEGLLGRSSSGATYLVRDQHVRDVPSNLFVLKEVVEPNKQARHRLASEGKLLRRLHHIGLPRIHRVLNDDKNNRVYLLMDYIAGQDLETLRHQQPENLFPWIEVMSIMAPIITVVTYLHRQQPPIIHGDIKPVNIIRPKEDIRVVLVDFGMLKVCDPDSTTDADRYCYRAPEQYNGSIDERTDMYALGATCYTVVTGKLPPDASSRLKQVGNEAMDPLEPVNNLVPAIPMSIGKAIDRAMSIDAQHRFSSVEQFWEALWCLEEHPAPVFGIPSVPKGPPAISEPERAVGQAIEKPVPEPPPAVPVPESIEEQEHLDIEKPPSVVPASAKEQKDLDVVHLLSKPSGDVRTSISLKKLGALFIVLALLISLGIGASFLSHTRSHPAAYSATPASHTAIPASTPTSAPVASSYPTLAGTYTGTIYDLNVNVSTSISLTGIQQNQGSFSGFLLLGPKMLSSGLFRGTIGTTKDLQFTVTDAAGNVTLFFEGEMQSATSLSGDYYHCRPGPIQGGKCSRAAGGYGIWNAVRASSGLSSSPCSRGRDESDPEPWCVSVFSAAGKRRPLLPSLAT
jgi:eukaryotic-like serine/threonine-protein kinase